jgi:hypothetical protein
MAEQRLAKGRESLGQARGRLDRLERLAGMADEAPVDGGDAWAFFDELAVGWSEDRPWPELEDGQFLAAVGVPEPEWTAGRGYEWEGWTAGMLRHSLVLFAQAAGVAPERLLGWALEACRSALGKPEGEVREAEREVQELRKRLRAQEGRLRLLRVLPEAGRWTGCCATSRTPPGSCCRRCTPSSACRPPAPGRRCRPLPPWT